MTPFYVEKRMSQLCPKEPHVLPNAPHTGVHWDTFSDSFNCKYLQISSSNSELQMLILYRGITCILGIPNC